MGAFFHNIAIKSEDKGAIVKHLKQDKQNAFVASAENGWTLIFPEDMLDIFDLAKKYSSDFKTIVTAGFIGDSDDFLFQLCSNGELIFDLELDKTSGKGMEIHTGDAKKLAQFALSQKDPAILDEILKNNHFVFEEERYRKVLQFLDMPLALGFWGYDAIIQAMNMEETDDLRELLGKDLPNLEEVN